MPRGKGGGEGRGGAAGRPAAGGKGGRDADRRLCENAGPAHESPTARPMPDAHSMKALWALFWSVCLLRRAPDELPRSLPLLAAVALLGLALGICSQFLGGAVAPVVAIVTVLLALVLDLAVLGALLAFKRQQALFVQALTAILGADLVLGLFSLPLVLAARLLGESPLTGVVVLLQMLLVGWNLGVRGFIYHRAARLGIFQGNMLALTLFLLNVFLVFKLFPELLAAPGAR